MKFFGNPKYQEKVVVCTDEILVLRLEDKERMDIPYIIDVCEETDNDANHYRFYNRIDKGIVTYLTFINVSISY
jgi:hypothetical protein